MTAISVTCVIGECDGEHSDAAAGFVRGFYPKIAVEILGGVAVLNSATASASEMTAIWRAALLNERLVSRSAATRERIIGELVR